MSGGFDFWLFTAGLALFIFAVFQIEDALKSLAGRPFKKFLQHQTSNKLKAILGGMVVTVMLQSSSVVMLITLTFVGAGVMSMRNALGVVLGSNLGTTIVNWLIALIGFKIDVEALSYPILAFVLIGLLFFNRYKVIQVWSRFLFGISLLFIGLSYMTMSLSGSAAMDPFEAFASYSPYLFIAVGFVLTAIIQSSNVTTAIALAALHSQIIPLEHAAAAIVGSELGTSIKLIFGAAGRSVDKKRVAWGNFIINVVTLFLGAVLLLPLIRFISGNIFPDNTLLSLVCFQSTINLIGIILFYPFLGNFAGVLERRITETTGSQQSRLIRSDLKVFTNEGIELAEMETRYLLQRSLRLNRKALGVEDEQESSWLQHLRQAATDVMQFTEQYNDLKQHQGEILEYVADLLKEDITTSQSVRLGKLVTVSRNIVHAAKNIKDIRHNLKELADTADDTLFHLFNDIRTSERQFYSMMEELLSQLDRPETASRLDQALKENIAAQDISIRGTLDLLREHKVKEFEASTLLNVYREIYSSHKAMLNALEDLVHAGQ